jgi:hypothetical protein
MGLPGARTSETVNDDEEFTRLPPSTSSAHFELVIDSPSGDCPEVMRPLCEGWKVLRRQAGRPSGKVGLMDALVGRRT